MIYLICISFVVSFMYIQMHCTRIFISFNLFFFSKFQICLKQHRNCSYYYHYNNNNNSHGCCCCRCSSPLFSSPLRLLHKYLNFNEFQHYSHDLERESTEIQIKGENNINRCMCFFLNWNSHSSREIRRNFNRIIWTKRSL